MNEHYHFYYIKDHLGNIRETYKIPNAGTKECVQRMQYYPSGLPWAESAGASEQPWKYNGKEFVEMHGLDEYDYGFRFYYPSIGRFTTLDPLGEYTPTHSPYVYANNNWSNEIDFMGLMGHRTNFTVLDSEGNTVYHEDNGDYGVYQLKEGEKFDKDKTDRNTLTQVGWELPYVGYTYGQPCLYTKVSYLQDNSYSAVIMNGNRYATPWEIKNYFDKLPFYISTLLSIPDELLQNRLMDILPKFAKHISYLPIAIQTINWKNLTPQEQLMLPLAYVPKTAWFLIYAEFAVPIFAQKMTDITQAIEYNIWNTMIEAYNP